MEEDDNIDNEYDIRLLTDKFSPLVSYLDTMASHLVATVVLHPLKCCSTLFLLGHGPLLQAEGRWYYAGLISPVFVYAKEIYDNEGVIGCFRGVTASIVLNFISKTIRFFISVNNVKRVLNSNIDSKFNEILKWNVIGVIVADIVSHPFLVISNRQIAQYVGKETTYDCGMIKALFEIAKSEGVSKWVCGVTPKVVADVTVLLVVYHSVHIYFKYIRERKYITYFMYGVITVVGCIVYPFYKVSTCMTVDGSGLKARLPLLMTSYGLNWIKYFNDFLRGNQLCQDSSLFWTLYIPLIK